MRHTTVRTSTMKVVDGDVRKKNLYRQSPDYYLTTLPQLVIERHNPDRGYVHAVSRDDVARFIALIPDWAQLSRGLNAILLVGSGYDADGYHRPGVLHLCSVREDLWLELHHGYFKDHQDIFERLKVPFREENDAVTCFFTEHTIRAYYLLHILLHELGHHHDRMTSRKKRESNRGESFAEEFAGKYEELVWPRYKEQFRLF